MIFSTFEFIFLFLPVVFTIYYILISFKLKTFSKWFLVFVSMFFYWYGSRSFFPFFVGSVLFNYFCGLILSKLHTKESKNRKNLVLLIGILANVTLLGYYKYTDFFIENYNFISKKSIPLMNIILPIGISFFTFQLIAYLVDSFKGETKEYKFLNYLLFITFFPQLIVGPIVHHKDVNYQYEDDENLRLNGKNIAKGLFLFFLGASKKLLIADNISKHAGVVFMNSEFITFADSWAGSLGYTISYYFDLSGYADMAIGLGWMFNIKIPINFNSPYKARNFADYWRRWHMTLSKFLGDYIFRNVKKKGGTPANFYWAIFVTFLVSGIWHGSGWTFVVWGVVNGIFVIFSHMMTRSEKKLPFVIAWTMTFLGVIGTRILFVSPNFKTAINVYKKMIGINFDGLIELAYGSKYMILFTFIGLFIALTFPNSNKLLEKFKLNIKYAIITGLLIYLTFTSLENAGSFLYFQF